MIKDPAPENFWRSAKWVKKRNEETVFNHSSKRRACDKRYKASEKGKASHRKGSKKYYSSEKGKASHRKGSKKYYERRIFVDNPRKWCYQTFGINQVPKGRP